MTIAAMETERGRIYWDYIKALGTTKEKELLKALNLMDEGIERMEQLEQELQEFDTCDNWEEWMIDHRIDMEREEQAAMAYER